MKIVALREQDLEDLELLLPQLSSVEKQTVIKIMHHVSKFRPDWAQRIQYFLEEGMADRRDQLFQEWHRLVGAVLLAEKGQFELVRSPEEVIAESTAHCRESGRLMWIVVDWLIRHVEEIDEQKLIRESIEQGDLSGLGVLGDIAHLRMSHPKFKRIMAACQPHPRTEPFFHRVARSRLATKLAQENGLEVFRRWNYWCQELRYL